MKLKYRKTLFLIGLLIFISGFIGIAYMLYDEVVIDDSSMIIVDSYLSINYLNGYKVKGNGEYYFSVTNNSNNNEYYNISLDNLKYDDKATYSLISEEENINIKDLKINSNTDVLLNSIEIKAHETVNFILIINNSIHTSFEIVVKTSDEIEEYFYATILKNNKVSENKDNTGLISDIDDDGITYYFKGNVNNNYVLLNNSLWRIVRINGDGTVRVILDTLAGNLTSYNIINEGYDEYLDDTIGSSLQTFYEDNLKVIDSYIANSKFCISTLKNNVNEETLYDAYTRISINNSPTFNCLGITKSSKIGLITVDEVLYAKGTVDSNENYYLYNSAINNIWWTSNLAVAKGNDFFPYVVDEKGNIKYDVSGLLNRGLRPVINLDKKIKINGEGTQDNPYSLPVD